MDKAAYDKLMKEVPTYKLITIGVLVDRLRVNGSVARRALVELEERELLRRLAIMLLVPFTPVPLLKKSRLLKCNC